MSPRRAQFKNEPAHARPAFIGSLENTFEVHCEAPELRTISLCRGHFDQLRGLLIYRSTLSFWTPALQMQHPVRDVTECGLAFRKPWQSARK
jgi:hypothetical protein